MKHFKHFLSEKAHKILFLSLLLFTFLRFPSLFEPNWYGDEGIYQIIGRGLRQGLPLYEGMWDNKPPLLYGIYALADGDQFMVRLLSFICGLITVVLFYKLAGLLLKNTLHASILTLIFAIIFASPYIEGNIANAENFMLLPIILGLLLGLQHLLKIPDKHSVWIRNAYLSFFVGGIFLGLSFMTKIVGVFDLLTLLIFLWFITPLAKAVKQSLFLLSGFIVPFAVIGIFFITTGGLYPYLSATFFSNVSYVGYENFFIIPQGLLIGKLLLLIVFLGLLLTKRKKFHHETLFIILWFGISMFNSFFSQRSYTHYALLSLPSVLLVGALIYTKFRKNMFLVIGYALVLVLLYFHFKPYPLAKTLGYYLNFFSYLTGRKSQTNYQTFFDADVPRDYTLAEYLNMKLPENGEVFIWSNSAQIYVLSDTLPINRYTVAYHINSTQTANETQQAIDAKQPQYIVITSDERLGNLVFPNYVYRLNLGNTAIYEHIN